MIEVSPKPMRMIIESVLSALDDDSILSYYRNEAWEAPLRVGFRKIVGTYKSGSLPDSEDNMHMLRRLNYGYRTRYSLSHLRVFGDTVTALAAEKGWWESAPPSLYGSSDEEAEILASAPSAIISDMAKKGLPRPYSLSTKCLHFLFPDSFAISDQQAIASIRMWAYFAFSQRDKAWSQQFDWDKINNMSGKGYSAVIDFYRLFYATADQSQKDALKAGAEKISNQICAYVSSVDVVDKLLWRANGDPAVLGFRLA